MSTAEAIAGFVALSSLLAGIIFFDSIGARLNWVRRNNAAAATENGDAGLIRYSDYELSRKESAVCLALSGTVLFAVGLLFYRNPFLASLLSACALLVPGWRRKRMIERRKEELKLQFKHALYAISTALGAGKSVENAFREVIVDL
jgi:Flp pilus assembly protein TadB